MRWSMAEEVVDRRILDDLHELSLAIEAHGVRLVANTEVLIEALGHFFDPHGLGVMAQRSGIRLRERREIERGADSELLLASRQNQIDGVHALIVAHRPSPTQTNHYRCVRLSGSFPPMSLFPRWGAGARTTLGLLALLLVTPARPAFALYEH